MLIQMLWQFSPATGTVRQYHIVDHLHAIDAPWGLWQAIFFGSFVPIDAAYAYLSRRFALRPLLWVGFITLIGPFLAPRRMRPGRHRSRAENQQR